MAASRDRTTSGRFLSGCLSLVKKREEEHQNGAKTMNGVSDLELWRLWLSKCPGWRIPA